MRIIISALLCLIYLNGQGQKTSSEVRIPDDMQDEMKYLKMRERSMADSQGIGSLYSEEERKIEVENIKKQQRELQIKIKAYQENTFKRLQESRIFQAKFKNSIKTSISSFKIGVTYKNVRIHSSGEVFPELTVISSGNGRFTVKVVTDQKSSAFLELRNTEHLYYAKP